MNQSVFGALVLCSIVCGGAGGCCRKSTNAPVAAERAPNQSPQPNPSRSEPFEAMVIRVERSNVAVRAEVDAGTADGLINGDFMTISRDGNFIANLRIMNPQRNRATGIVSLESDERGPVQVGDSAYWVPMAEREKSLEELSELYQ